MTSFLLASTLCLATIPGSFNVLGTDPEAYRSITLKPVDAETAEVVTPTNALLNGVTADYAWSSPNLTVKMVPTMLTCSISLSADGYVPSTWTRTYTEFLASPKLSLAKEQEHDTCIGQTKWTLTTDLDVHMLVMDGDTQLVHIGYGNTGYKGTWTDPNGHGKITHKLDDLKGGAGCDGETLTIYSTYAGYAYKYYMYSFSKVDISTTGAETEVTYDNRRAATINIADATGTTGGYWWHVFDIIDGQIVTVNKLVSNIGE